MKRAILALAGLLAVVALFAVSRHRAPEGRAAPGTRAAPGDVAASGEEPSRLFAPEAAETTAGADDERANAEVSLLGQVIDSDEAPVSGATVHLSGTRDVDLASDSGGVFHVSLLPGPYVASAQYGELVSAGQRVTITADSEPLTLRVARGSELVARVLDARDGRPIPGATVRVEGTSAAVARTGADGRGRIGGVRNGIFDVTASAEGYATASQTVRVAGEPRQVVASLARGGGVEGVVRDPEGRGVAGARVTADAVADAFAPPGGIHTTSGPDGAFRFDGLAAGEHRVSASHDELGLSEAARVLVRAEASRQKVEVTLRRGSVLTGRVVSTSGRPVAGALVRAVRPEYASTDLFARETRSDAKGAFRIAGLTGPTVRVTAATTVAFSPPAVLSVQKDQPLDGVRLVLDADDEIEGTVRDASGAPAAEAQVIAVPEQGKDWRAPTSTMAAALAVSDSKGHFRLTQLAKGSYRLRAGPGGSADTTDVLERKSVVVTSGVKDAVVLLEPARRAYGRVSISGATTVPPFSVTLGDGFAHSFPGGDGAFEVRDVPSGKHMLAVSGAGIERNGVNVQVADGPETDLGVVVVERARSIRGHVVGADGAPVANATVRAGGMLFASGDSITGRASSDDSLGASTSTSGPDGAFQIDARDGGPCFLVAERADVGRSSVAQVGSDGDGGDVLLTLQPSGAVEGTVTRAGAPVGGELVVAVPTQSPRTRFAVRTGLDGHYRFDALAPGAYVLSAKTGGSDVQPTMQSGGAQIEPGATAHVDLQAGSGSATLTVSVTSPAGGGMGQIFLFTDAVRAENMGDLEMLLATRASGTTEMRTVAPGIPAVFTELDMGSYTACMVARPAGAARTGAAAAGAMAKVACQPVEVKTSDAEATINAG